MGVEAGLDVPQVEPVVLGAAVRVTLHSIKSGRQRRPGNLDRTSKVPSRKLGDADP